MSTIQVLTGEQAAKLFDSPTTKCTWREAVARWKAGKTVWTAELGGFGPGYEQAIQILLWEILARWEGDAPKLDPALREFPAAYSEHVDRVVRDLADFGFSGAQVGSAKSTAFQFMVYGYEHMMGKLEKDRHIMVSRDFPTLPRSA